MKYTVKLILWRESADGTFPIYIRITINRNRRYIATQHRINKQFWDDKNQKVKDNHPSADIINADIFAQKNEVLNGIVNTKLKGEKTTASLVKQKNKEGLADGSDFFQFVEIYKDAVGGKRAGGTTENYRKHAEKLKNYQLSLEKRESGTPTLPFEAITPDYLTSYEKYLINSGLGINYTYILLRSIRTMFNAAIKRGVTSYYPFKVYELPKYMPPEKDVITIQELDRLERIADGLEAVKDKDKKNQFRSEKHIRQTAIYFLFGAYTGLRVSDWYQFDLKKHIRNNEVLLRAGKNKEWIVIEIHPRLQRTLERISENPLIIYEQDINDELKHIFPKKKVTNHTSRHTFAVTLCAERGVSCETCATLLGITFETCAENYYKVTPLKIKTETNKAWEGI